ncbi:MAG: hypothetical protein VB835_13015 [Pirellulales bacterium]
MINILRGALYPSAPTTKTYKRRQANLVLPEAVKADILAMAKANS